jgi:thioredoxin 1
MAVQAVTDATFEAEVLRSELPVLVDLYADWCQPCKQLAPIVAQVADELAGKIKVVNVDVDSNPMVAQTFRAQSIPMLLVIAQGKVAQQYVGVLDKPGLLRLLEPVMPPTGATGSPRRYTSQQASWPAAPKSCSPSTDASACSTAAAKRPKSGERSSRPMASKSASSPAGFCIGKPTVSRSNAVEAFTARGR